MLIYIIINFLKIEVESQKFIDSGLFIYIIDYFKQLETEQGMAQQSFSNSAGNNEKTLTSLQKIQSMTLRLCSDVLRFELEKNPKQCQIIQILQSMPSADTVQCLIIEKLLKYYCKYSEMKKEAKMGNTLKNLSSVINNNLF